MCLQLGGASGIQTQRNFESDAGSDMVIVTLSPLVVTILHPQPFQHEFELIFSGDHHNAHVARDKSFHGRSDHKHIQHTKRPTCFYHLTENDYRGDVVQIFSKS